MAFVVGNWKMNLLREDSVKLATGIREQLSRVRATEIWVAPSFLSIPEVCKLFQGTRVRVGSQTLHGEPKGAFTGEVSASMLKEVGGSFTLIGHSERRSLGEIDSLLSKKAKGVLSQGITPIYCIGETLEEFDRGLTHEVLRIQLSALFQEINSEELSQCLIAYEPRWAIGSGKVPTSEVIANIHSFIASQCGENKNTAPNAILYGGSMTGENAAEILAIPFVDGGLIGGASLKADAFMAIVEASELRAA